MKSHPILGKLSFKKIDLVEPWDPIQYKDVILPV